jgi:large subunit ribosomal protein L6
MASRILKMILVIPSSVKVVFDGNFVHVTGPYGTSCVKIPPSLDICMTEDVVNVSTSSTDIALLGTIKILINNLIKGVILPYVKTLELIGIGYKAQPPEDGRLTLLLGYSHPVVLHIPSTVSVKLISPTKFTVTSVNKGDASAFCALVVRCRVPDAYKGKGVHHAGKRMKLKTIKKK